MNEQQLLRALSSVNEEYITEAIDAPSPKRTVKKWLIVAACIAALLALSVTTLALTDAGVRIRQFFADGSESGYDIEVQIQPIPQSQILGDVLPDAVETIRQQVRDYKPYMSWFPMHFMKEFDSTAEAVEYIGYEPLRLPDLGWTEETVSVNALSTLDVDHISELYLNANYVQDRWRMCVFARLYTEHYTGDLSTGALRQGDVDFSEASYVNKNRIPCVIVHSTADAWGNCGINAYLVTDNVFYSLSISYQEGEKEAAEAILKQWLNEF